jgi:hypothetical protein
MVPMGDPTLPPGFINLQVEARYTVAAIVNQASYAAAMVQIHVWMTDPVRQNGDCLLVPCASVSLRYGAPRRMPRPAPPMH